MSAPGAHSSKYGICNEWNQLSEVIIKAQLNYLNKRSSRDGFKASIILGANVLM